MGDIELAFERNFDTLLEDSIEFMLESLKLHPVEDFGHTLSRASIVFSLLLLEAAANTCVEHLKLEKSIHNEIDRLPVLGKFDFYLRTNFKGRQLERGIHQIEWVKELKGLRDSLVHLKPHKIEWVKHKYSESGASTEAVRTKCLGVATNPKFWDGQEAAKVAIGVHGFLSFFFKEKCKYSAKKVTSLLFSESKIPGDDNYFMICMDKSTKNQLIKIGVDLSYLKIA